MNKSHAGIAIILISVFHLISTEDKCTCNKPKPKEVVATQHAEDQTRKCSCCSSCSSCCKRVELCNCVGQGTERKCSCCSSCSKPCCKTVDRCACNKPKPHRTPTTQAPQPANQDDSSQRILQHFAGIVENFAEIVKNPDNTQNVAEQMTHMFAGVIKIAAEGTRSESERRALEATLTRWLVENFDDAQKVTRHAVHAIRSE